MHALYFLDKREVNLLDENALPVTKKEGMQEGKKYKKQMYTTSALFYYKLQNIYERYFHFISWYYSSSIRLGAMHLIQRMRKH